MIRLFDVETDAPRLLRLFNTLEALDGDPEPSTEAHIRAQLQWRGHNPATDRWVAEHPGDPDTLIAHAWVFQQTHQRTALKVTVHPDWQRRGIGSQLMAVALDRARANGTPCQITDEWAHPRVWCYKGKDGPWEHVM